MQDIGGNNSFDSMSDGVPEVDEISESSFLFIDSYNVRLGSY